MELLVLIALIVLTVLLGYGVYLLLNYEDEHLKLSLDIRRLNIDILVNIRAGKTYDTNLSEKMKEVTREIGDYKEGSKEFITKLREYLEIQKEIIKEQEKVKGSK